MGQQTAGMPQQAQPGTERTIAPYYAGPGPAGTAYAGALGTEGERVGGWTAGTNPMISGEAERIGAWGASNAPNFETMFSKYIDVANREAARQSGKIGEQLGSRGALYSSANLQQQADLRQRMQQDIGQQATGFLTNIENQRQQAEQVRQQGWAGMMGARTAAETAAQAGRGQVLTGQAGVAQAEYGAREAAMARAYQDFLRRSEVPPLVSPGLQGGFTRPSPGTYAT
jgi:hypothetical protein